MIAKGRKERRKERNWLENMERLKKGDGIVRHPLIFHTERSRHINISLIWCTQGLVLKVFPTLLKCKSDWCSFTCKSYSLQTNHLSVEMKRSPISGVSNWSPLNSTTSKKKVMSRGCAWDWFVIRVRFEWAPAWHVREGVPRRSLWSSSRCAFLWFFF